MSNPYFHRFFCLFSLLSILSPGLIASTIVNMAYADETTAFTSYSSQMELPDFVQVWFDSGTAYHAKQIQADVFAGVTPENSQNIQFKLNIDSNISFRDVVIIMQIYDANNVLVKQGRLLIDLFPGENECFVELDVSDTSPGAYTADFSIHYTRLEAPARYTLPFTKISSNCIMTDMARLEAILASMQSRLESEAGILRNHPNFYIRISIIDEFIQQVRDLIHQHQFRQVYPVINHLLHSARSINTEHAFSSLIPERLESIASHDLSQVHAEDSSLIVDSKPVFLLGARTALSDTHEIQRLHRFGINLLVPEVTPDITMSGPASMRPVDVDLHYYLNQAAQHNMAVIPVLQKHTPAGWMLETWPNLMPETFLNVAHAGYQSALEAHLREILPVLNRSANVIAASILDQPHFKYDNERVHRLFIESIKGQYRDRFVLNASWRSHLADFDEITIWGTYPDYSYQNRRAYQYDWQHFHHNMIHTYLTGLLNYAESLAPNLDISMIQSPNSFVAGETRFGIDREKLARTLPINAITTSTSPDSGLYSMEYPGATGFYTLLKSFTGDKPAVDLDLEIANISGLNSLHAYRFVNAVVWEAAIAGMNGLAISSENEVWQRPETLEGLAIANLDINRLAPYINAITNTPTDVGILYSISSKMFDGGAKHLESAWNAFEGSSFSGYTVRFITEEQIQQGKLDEIKVLILPETPSLENATFEKIHAYILGGGTICRAGTPIPYTPHGHSRTEVLPSSGKTVLVRGINLPTEYLHAMDAAIILGTLPVISRPINAFGYPLEGVKTRMVQFEGDTYLYVINLRKNSVVCHLAGNLHSGRDLIRGRDVAFPMKLEPLDPMLIRMDRPVYRMEMTALNQN